MIVLDRIPVNINFQTMCRKMKFPRESEFAGDLEILTKEAQSKVSPKALYTVSFVELIDKSTIKIDGVQFYSKVLRKNLEKTKRVFPFVVTCGKELDELECGKDYFLRQYWIDVIKEMVLDAGIDFLKSHLLKKYELIKLYSMSPGSGAENIWPIEQQKELFSLFGDVEKLIGVRLTDSCLMIPNKSVSGFYFAGGIDFISCKLCERENCRGRKAPFDINLKNTIER